MSLKHLHGATAKIKANKSGHYFDIGTIVNLIYDEHCGSDDDIKAYADEDYWYVGEDDIELIAVSVTYEQIKEIAASFTFHTPRTYSKQGYYSKFDEWSSGMGKELMSVFTGKPLTDNKDKNIL